MRLVSLASDPPKTSASPVTSPCYSDPTSVATWHVLMASTSILSLVVRCAATSSPTLSPATRLKLSSAQPPSNSKTASAGSAAKSKGTTLQLRPTPVLKSVVMESCSITNVMMAISWMATDVPRTASSKKDGAVKSTHLDQHQCANWKRHSQ